ncbi:MAG: hypothetical protein KDA89_12070 [Planctomycetaceae bacterium]|nr:hypothetical protein [Planctomycetaceae bacterium]
MPRAKVRPAPDYLIDSMGFTTLDGSKRFETYRPGNEFIDTVPDVEHCIDSGTSLNLTANDRLLLTRIGEGRISKAEAARMIGIDRRTLYRRLEKLRDRYVMEA